MSLKCTLCIFTQKHLPLQLLLTPPPTGQMPSLQLCFQGQTLLVQTMMSILQQGAADQVLEGIHLTATASQMEPITGQITGEVISCFRAYFGLGIMLMFLCPAVLGGSIQKWTLALLMVPLFRTLPCTSLWTLRLKGGLGLGIPLLECPDLMGLLCLGGPTKRRRRKKCLGGQVLPSLPSLTGVEEEP